VIINARQEQRWRLLVPEACSVTIQVRTLRELRSFQVEAPFQLAKPEKLTALDDTSSRSVVKAFKRRRIMCSREASAV
jgi:hypothetical protein